MHQTVEEAIMTLQGSERIKFLSADGASTGLLWHATPVPATWQRIRQDAAAAVAEGKSMTKREVIINALRAQEADRAAASERILNPLHKLPSLTSIAFSEMIRTREPPAVASTNAATNANAEIDMAHVFGSFQVLLGGSLAAEDSADGLAVKAKVLAGGGKVRKTFSDTVTHLLILRVEYQAQSSSALYVRAAEKIYDVLLLDAIIEAEGKVADLSAFKIMGYASVVTTSPNCYDADPSKWHVVETEDQAHAYYDEVLGMKASDWVRPDSFYEELVKGPPELFQEFLDLRDTRNSKGSSFFINGLALSHFSMAKKQADLKQTALAVSMCQIARDAERKSKACLTAHAQADPDAVADSDAWKLSENSWIPQVMLR
jgi:hypothetical protein